VPEATLDQAAEQERSRANRDELVLGHLHLVKAIARRLHAGLPKSVDFSDLEQAGVLGLISAATKYNSSVQTPFDMYARHRIKGAMLDSLRQSDWVSRNLRRREKQVNKAVQKLTATLQRQPAETEIAGELEIGVAELRGTLTALRNARVVSASTPRTDDDTPIDSPGSPNDSPQFIYAQKECHGLVRAAIQRLPARHRTLISQLFYQDHSRKEISHAMGVHESRVSQIRTSALQKLGDSLRPQGVCSSRVI
jgi:RNA polymerase sigma factor for flagellar operon FliA